MQRYGRLKKGLPDAYMDCLSSYRLEKSEDMDVPDNIIRMIHTVPGNRDLEDMYSCISCAFACIHT